MCHISSRPVGLIVHHGSSRWKREADGSPVAGSVQDMSRRLLEFPPEAGIPVDLVEQVSSPDGFRFISSLPPGPEREAALEAERESLRRGASKLDSPADELRELVLQHDPVELISSIAVPAAIGLGDPMSRDDATETFSAPAKIEFLVGLALSGPPGTAQVPMEVTQKAVGLLAAVFSAADAHLRIQAVSEHNDGDPGLDQTSYLLRFEYLLDRMGGYDIHLEEIGDAIFEPHRDLYIRELGFCPSDAIRLVRRHVAWTNTVFNTARQEIFETMNSDDVDEDKAGDSGQRFYLAMEAVYRWTPEVLAESTGLPAQQIREMLERMSVYFGCQPDFRVPFDENKARRYPLVRLPKGEYLAADPWSVAHNVHEWLQHYVLINPTSRIASRYPKHRSNAAERLVHVTLQELFEEEAVFRNQHYDGKDGPGEIDVLVTGFTPIIVEVKSRGLTEKGRQGRRRVKTVAQDVVGTSFAQTHRASSYIAKESGRSFANRQGGLKVRLLYDDVTDHPVEIVVTLERMDPLATAAAKLAGTEQPRNIWITNLADFLMVRDILTDPFSFLHYAQTRGKTTARGIHIYTESDALGRYLDDRLAPLIERATETQGESWETLLGYSGTDINQFFTMAEMDSELKKPGTGVPPVLIEALRSTASDAPRSAATVATAVMAAPPSKWRKWRGFVRRHKTGRPFLLPCGTAALVASTSVSSAEIQSGAVPVLTIPRREARSRWNTRSRQKPPKGSLSAGGTAVLSGCGFCISLGCIPMGSGGLGRNHRDISQVQRQLS